MEKYTSQYYKPFIDSLVKFMINNGIELKPLPRIFLNNSNQGEDFVKSRTGYYEPETKSITVFVNNRHPKDVMRSLAHELIHHNQNVKGNDMLFNTSSLGEDSKLDKLEEDAYRRGNIFFRKWTEQQTRKENK